MILYGIVFDYRILIIYISILSIYFLGALTTENSKYNTLRRRIMIASWDNPESPIISNMQLDVTNVLAFLKKFPQDKKVTLTHFFIKILALIYS